MSKIQLNTGRCSHTNTDYVKTISVQSSVRSTLWLVKKYMKYAPHCQRGKQRILSPVQRLRLLTFSFIWPGTFPSVGLSLLVETPNADPLPSTNRDVLFNKARQHSCKMIVCKISQIEANLASLSTF